jgi:hypothetical protein
MMREVLKCGVSRYHTAESYTQRSCHQIVVVYLNCNWAHVVATPSLTVIADLCNTTFTLTGISKHRLRITPQSSSVETVGVSQGDNVIISIE